LFAEIKMAPYICVTKAINMTLTPEQIKIAKAACKAAGIDTKVVTKEIGNGFWIEKCGGTFEGYLTYITTPFVSDNSTEKMLLQGKTDYANGIYGASKFRR